MARTPLAEIRDKTYKRRDAWWTVLLVDPLASRLVWLVQPYRWVTPNLLSVLAFVFGLGAAAGFATAEWRWMAVGAALFHFSFVLDCMDGKIARLNGTGSPFGAWLDYMLDRLRVMICGIALFGGQYAVTGDIWYVLVGAGVVFLDALHHVNALERSRVRAGMRTNLAQARERVRVAEATLAGGVVVAEDPEVVDEHAEFGPVPVRDPKPDWRTSFKPFLVARHALLSSRIRPNLISTIEMHMAVFIIAPLFVGALLPITIGVNAVLIIFDIALSANLFLSTRSYARTHAAAIRRAEAAEQEVALRAPRPAESAAPLTDERVAATA